MMLTLQSKLIFMKIGLAFSGGGARGIAHIGVIKAFEEAGIKPDIVSGTSAGAIIGSMVCRGKSADEMRSFVEKSVGFRALSFSNPWRGMASLASFEKLLSDFLEIKTFEELNLPFYLAAADLESGDIEIINSGVLAKAVMASSAVPLAFRPIDLNGKIYTDGGVLMNLPTQPIRDKVDFLIGINVRPKLPISKEKVRNIMGIAERTFDLSLQSNMQPSRKLCDFIIEPEGITNYHIFQFLKWKEIYELGYESGKKAVNGLQKHL